jgi:hypothetical protein
MNLIFKVKGGAGYVDFPFQSDTNLTRAVLAESDNTKRIKIIGDQLIAWKWDRRVIIAVMETVKDLFNSPNLEIDQI